MSDMSNTEEREDTACIEITCSVKGYQECNFTVDVGEEFFIFKKIGVKRQLHWISSILFDFVRLYWFDWFENRTHSKIGVRFCSIAEPNRTIGVRLGSIGFLFGFVRLDRSGLLGSLNGVLRKYLGYRIPTRQSCKAVVQVLIFNY